jgi:hypothetical protein
LDILNYFQHRERDLQASSVSIDDVSFVAAPDGRVGRVEGNITLRADPGLDAYLKVFERIELRDDRFEIVKYSYYLIANETERWGRDYDPSKHPEQPIHGHVGEDHVRVPSERITLRDALDLAWDEVSSMDEEDPYAG